jgi:ribosomal protein S18 acetylase RimI-like enzyme
VSHAFRAPRPDHLRAAGVLAAQGITLRWLDDGDLPWLAELYADTRADEMAALPWPGHARRAFVHQQFMLQHQHYLAEYADAEFLAVCRRGVPAGRLYLRRTAPMHLVVDISLFADARGQGVGRALLAAAQHDATCHGRGMALHVLQHNAAARRLYTHLGFVEAGGNAPYLRMEWHAAD